jgi:uncharacterized glyoxalase superfamily protein PhnB
VIAVQDLAASARFYRDKLGFEVHEIGDDGWRFFVRDDCFVMAGECADAMPARELGDHSYFAYVEVDHIDAFYESVASSGVDMIKRLRTEPWGMREFGIATPDGHRMMFGQQTGGFDER